MLDVQSIPSKVACDPMPASKLGRVGKLKRLLIRKLMGFQLHWQEVLNQRLCSFIETLQESDLQLQQQVCTLRAEIESLNNQLRVPPYVTDNKFSYHDADGRAVIGFKGNSRKQQSQIQYELDFLNSFRGPESLIKQRQAVYMQFLQNRRLVIDCGAGRGEFLELAAENDITAIGLELNSALVDYCYSKGFSNIEKNDCLSFLKILQNEVPDAIFSCQVIEHLPFDYLYEFVCVAQQKLTTGGIFIAETANPHCLGARKLFPIDPTHVRPLFPEFMIQLCYSAGFSDAYVFYPECNSNDAFEYWKYGDYAVIATK